MYIYEKLKWDIHINIIKKKTISKILIYLKQSITYHGQTTPEHIILFISVSLLVVWYDFVGDLLIIPTSPNW